MTRLYRCGFVHLGGWRIQKLEVCAPLFGELLCSPFLVWEALCYTQKKQLNSYISQMELIQEKVNFIRSEYKTWYDYNPNETGNFYTYLQSLGYSNANDSNNPYIDEFNNIIKSINEENPKNWNENIDIVLANYCYFSSDDLKKYFNIDNIDFNLTTKSETKLFKVAPLAPHISNLYVPEVYGFEFESCNDYLP